MSDRTTPAIGDHVFVEQWSGLTSIRAIVAEPAPRPDYFALDFAHNGNRIPGYYHRDLLVLA